MIAVRGLKKRIGTQEILRGVDISVATGETLVIIGRSGGGKSVLLKNLIGLMQPNEGEIWIDGQNIIGLGERQRLRLFVLQVRQVARRREEDQGEAETEAFGRLLGTPVQRLATIAHGDGICTTHEISPGKPPPVGLTRASVLAPPFCARRAM